MTDGDKIKAVQVRVTESEWRFIRRLAVEKDTTISDIFRRYIRHLQGGGKLIGYENERR
ncbi:hypothetical protein [Desulfofundulus thermobenzoicus]|uniref:hypothetical protein n=1 Tax=Desulfofundulus thermobenzoicus TaxID=29376 RepID=UPI00128F56B9|nr:hypothetical protein [Desulfofundulus thermobenzoicus]